MRKSNGIISPNRGANKKYLSCHHPVFCISFPSGFSTTNMATGLKSLAWIDLDSSILGGIFFPNKIDHRKVHTSGQISIIPKPECFGDFGEVPLLNHHLG